MNIDLSARRVVVTGGANDIGRSLAIEAASRGARVVLGDLVSSTETVREIRDAGGVATDFIVDTTDPQSLESFSASARQFFGEPDLVVLAAPAQFGATGAAGMGKLYDADPIAARTSLDAVVFGMFNAVQEFVPRLIGVAAEGRAAHLLLVGSDHSIGVPHYAPAMSTYTVGKYATLGIADVLRRDLNGTGVGVALLAPGWVRTESSLDLVRASGDWARIIEPYAQQPAVVAREAFDGLLAGRYIIVTNPVSRSFAMDHARAVMAEVQHLSVRDDDSAHAHDGTGDPANCPVMPFLVDSGLVPSQGVA